MSNPSKMKPAQGAQQRSLLMTLKDGADAYGNMIEKIDKAVKLRQRYYKLLKVAGKKAADSTLEQASKTWIKWKQRVTTIRDIIDPEKRDSTLFSLGLKWATKRLGEVLDFDLEKHPYFVFHKAHFEALKILMNAVAVKEELDSLMESAISIAGEVITRTSVFLEEYDMQHGAAWLSFASDSTELGGLLYLYSSESEMSHAQVFRLGWLMNRRETTMRQFCAAYGILGGEFEQFEVAVGHYVAKKRKVADGGGLAGIFAMLNDQADILKSVHPDLNTVAGRLAKAVKNIRDCRAAVHARAVEWSETADRIDASLWKDGE